MLASSPFFKLFPPPSFMLMPHAGLNVSDDAIRCLAYSGSGLHRKLSVHGAVDLPPGLMEGGDAKDETQLVALLSDFAKAYGLSHVKVSIPEEKAYLFQTDVPATDHLEIQQNIEFKLEENVPLSAQDAMFYFDILPASASTGGQTRASVSVVPRTYIEHQITLLQSAGLSPIAFEVAPKSIARSVVPPGTSDSKLIIHVMNQKTGIYVVAGGVPIFASTASWGGGDRNQQAETSAAMTKEISRVRTYWASHGTGQAIDEVILVGKNAPAFEAAVLKVETDTPLAVRIGDVWQNAFDLNSYLPPIPRAESLDYAVVAGLAFNASSEAPKLS